MDIHLINRRLKDIYGVDFLNQPIYRIVWSNDEIEKRFGTFTDYIPGTNIFIREVTEVREVKKYNYLEPQYVLEKLFFNQHNKEILDNKTLAPQICTYEPLHAFGHEKNGRAKEVVWRAVELLLMMVNNPKLLTPSQMNDVELAQAAEDEKIMIELMNTHIKSDAMHSSIADGDTIMMNDATQKRELIR